MSFVNKVVLITGASSGIGAATAIQFAKEGAGVAIVGRNIERLDAVAEKCKSCGKSPLVIKADVSNEKETPMIVAKTIEKFGKLDILVNNAGIFRNASMLDDNVLPVFDEVMNTNFRAVVNVTNLAAPHIVKTKGNIINISSIAGKSLLKVPTFGAYCASKAAVDQFSRSVALELAPHGVRVNVVSPGPVKTDILAAAGSDTSIEDMVYMTALDRISRPEEISNLVMFLASDKATSITGSNYNIDNGSLLVV